MKKLLVLSLILVSCKTSKHKCDAYGSINKSLDIHEITFESQKKFSSVITIKK